MAYLTNWIVVEVQPVEIAAQALVPAFFIGMCAFMFSTILRNGNGTAVVLIIVGILLFFLDMVLGVSYWNVLMNPYDIPLEQNPIIFYDTLFYNRIAVMTASIVLLIVGLNSMRKREKFIKCLFETFCIFHFKAKARYSFIKGFAAAGNC